MTNRQIYLAAAIAAGRDFAPFYEVAAKAIADVGGSLLTPQVLRPDDVDANLDAAVIYARDVADLARADAVVAEVSVPSLGVGFELSCAVRHGHPILALCHAERASRLSALVVGCPSIHLTVYRDEIDIKNSIYSFLDSRV